jgi:pimeloyl-ACP methyl ester carboxylesterase
VRSHVEHWLRANDAEPDALLHVLDSIVATPVEAIGRIQVPTLVVMGADDERAASVDELVAALPRGTKAMAPENHRTAASSPEFAAGIVDFLSDTPCPRLQ